MEENLSGITEQDRDKEPGEDAAHVFVEEGTGRSS